jgi:hypothetical protein
MLFVSKVVQLMKSTKSSKAFQVPAPSKATDVPVAATGIVMHDEYARTIGRIGPPAWQHVHSKACPRFGYV